MKQAIVVYESNDILITIDSDELAMMTQAEIDEVIRAQIMIHESMHTDKTGESDFFGDVTEGSTPPPVYENERMKPIIGRWHYPHSSPATYEKPSWIKRLVMKIVGVEWRAL